jgi:protein-disulfide isomerase
MKARCFLRKLAGENIWNKRYILAVLLVSASVLVIGAILWSSGTQRVTPDVACTGWCRGAETPAVVIDSYPDFECPACVSKEILIMQALGIYPDQVRHDYHHYPYSEFSQKLAEALEAAGEQGMFWELHDRFLEDVPSDMNELLDMAEDIGLDMGIFTDSLYSGRFSDKVIADKVLAVSSGVRHVSVFINGKEYKGASDSFADLCNAIDEELERMGVDDGN